MSTLRYANRAKNILNKPTVNEDPNVRLIRELREEIDKLRSMVSHNDPTAARKLAVKEAQERHLTEEWTEKWKEAANILKEQQVGFKTKNNSQHYFCRKITDKNRKLAFYLMFLLI